MSALHQCENGTYVLHPWGMPRSLDAQGDAQDQGRFVVAYSRDGWFVLDAELMIVLRWCVSEEDACAVQKACAPPACRECGDTADGDGVYCAPCLAQYGREALEGWHAAKGRYAIFTRRMQKRSRRMHAVTPGSTATVCGLPIGIGSGLVRDGDYRNNVPCPTCWHATREGGLR